MKLKVRRLLCLFGHKWETFLNADNLGNRFRKVAGKGGHRYNLVMVHRCRRCGKQKEEILRKDLSFTKICKMDVDFKNKRND